jgi:hypothetical protein
MNGSCRCEAGYQEVNGNCQPVVMDDACAGLSVTDISGGPISGSRTFSLGDRLRLSLNSSKSESAYRFQLVPMQGVVTGSFTDAIALGQTGSFSLNALYTAAGTAAVRKLPWM